MDVTLYYEDGREATFVAETMDTHADLAYVDGVMHTNVESVSVEVSA